MSTSCAGEQERADHHECDTNYSHNAPGVFLVPYNLTLHPASTLGRRRVNKKLTFLLQMVTILSLLWCIFESMHCTAGL